MPPLAPRPADERSERATIFENALLERLTFVHPAVNLVVFLPAIVWLGWTARSSYGLGPAVILMSALGGLVVWSLAEYLMHRFVFHYRASSPFGRRLVFLIHGVHHNFPFDPRVSVSLAISAPIGVAAYVVTRAVLGAALGAPTCAGFLLGFVAYDLAHTLIHRSVTRALGLRALRAYHLRHHFDEQARQHRYGVTSPIWDFVFGTRLTSKRRARAERAG